MWEEAERTVIVLPGRFRWGLINVHKYLEGARKGVADSLMWCPVTTDTN